MATKAKKSKKSGALTNPVYFTKAEAKAIHEDIASYFSAMKRRHGKKFDYSVGVATVVFCGENGKKDPKSVYSYGNANTQTMAQIASNSIASVAESMEESPMKVGLMLSLKAISE